MGNGVWWWMGHIRGQRGLQVNTAQLSLCAGLMYPWAIRPFSYQCGGQMVRHCPLSAHVDTVALSLIMYLQLCADVKQIKCILKDVPTIYILTKRCATLHISWWLSAYMGTDIINFCTAVSFREFSVFNSKRFWDYIPLWFEELYWTDIKCHSSAQWSFFYLHNKSSVLSSSHRNCQIFWSSDPCFFVWSQIFKNQIELFVTRILIFIRL